MATFIPEWSRVVGHEIALRSVLRELDDEHIVRRPLRRESCAADVFVQHRSMGWLAVACDDAKFNDLQPSQLFEPARRRVFEQRLEALAALCEVDGARGPRRAMACLVVLTACSSDEARALGKGAITRHGVRFVSKAQFLELGRKLIVGLLTPLATEVEHAMLGRYFPEAEVAAACTTRRHFRRDNTAQLTRYFLDAQQEWASKLDLDMPDEQTQTTKDCGVRLVNGVAGSGKTLIAIHRALLLAELFPAQRVLVLIHNKPIVADLKERLHRTGRSVPGNLEITTFFAWASRQWRRAYGARPRFVPDGEVVIEAVRQLRTRWPELKPSDAQLVQEIDFINDYVLFDEASYLAAARSGRGFALRPKERSHVWALHQAVTQQLKSAQVHLWSAVPAQLCRAIERHAMLERFHHVLVDEAQFFAPAWFQLVKLALEPHGQLFLCADPNQGFMKRRLSWKSVGLDVAGRTKKLRRSYRTTRAILESASGVLATLGRVDAEDYLEPDYVGMEVGERPALVYVDAAQDAVDRCVAEIKALAQDHGMPLSAALVLYGDGIKGTPLYRRLIASLGAARVWWFGLQEQSRLPPHGYGSDYLRMAYLDSATGLEGGLVLLLGVENLFFGENAIGLSTEERTEVHEESARKLYMAMTRAGQRLVLVASQRLPTAMAALFDVSS